MTQTQTRKALVVDDAAEFRTLVSSILRADGFDVTEATGGAEAVEAARADDPEVIILDVSMPEIDGVEACRRIRGFSDAYIMMLTARDEEIDVLVGLAVGADGYMTKPFSPRELAARVKAMSRRRLPDPPSPATEPAQPGAVRQFGALEVDPLSRTATVDGVEVALTRTEFDLLDVLTSNPRVTFRREVLLERIWGENYFGDDHVVDVHMANLRRKLGDDAKSPRFFRTYRGVGYRMVTAS